MSTEKTVGDMGRSDPSTDSDATTGEVGLKLSNSSAVQFVLARLRCVSGCTWFRTEDLSHRQARSWTVEVQDALLPLTFDTPLSLVPVLVATMRSKYRSFFAHSRHVAHSRHAAACVCAGCFGTCAELRQGRWERTPIVLVRLKRAQPSILTV